MPETRMPSPADFSYSREQYEKGMKPTIGEHLDSKLDGDSPLLETRNQSMMRGIEEDARGENAVRDELRGLEKVGLKGFGNQGDTEEEQAKKKEAAIGRARQRVEEASKKNL